MPKEIAPAATERKKKKRGRRRRGLQREPKERGAEGFLWSKLRVLWAFAGEILPQV